MKDKSKLQPLEIHGTDSFCNEDEMKEKSPRNEAKVERDRELLDVIEEDTKFNARIFKFILMNRNSFERTV